jgi:hypothetical protein
MYQLRVWAVDTSPSREKIRYGKSTSASEESRFPSSEEDVMAHRLLLVARLLHSTRTAGTTNTDYHHL